jgi:3-hydroxyacyl-CoA dehydrogenase
MEGKIKGKQSVKLNIKFNYCSSFKKMVTDGLLGQKTRKVFNEYR